MPSRDRSIAWLIAVTVLIGAGGCSKYGKVEGQVVDLISSKPVPGATVTVKGTTLSTATDEQGRYTLAEIVPGGQVVTVEKQGYLSLAELPVTVAQRTVAKAAELKMIPQPPGRGLFDLTGGSMKAVPEVPESSWDHTINGDPILVDARMPKDMSLASPVDLLFYDGTAPPPVVRFGVYSLEFHRADSAMFISNPARWLLVSEPTAPVTVEAVGGGVTRIRGVLNAGVYCVRRTNIPGTPDWLYVFRIGGATAGGAEGASTGARSPSQLNAACDNIYVALNGEIANELDGAMNGGTGTCTVKTNSGVIQCILDKHTDEKNPRDPKLQAYTSSAPQPCQVQLSTLSTNGVTFAQRVQAGRDMRTFSIRVD